MEQVISEDELLEELERLYIELQRTPTQDDMTEIGKFGHSTYHDRFGSWNSALEEAELEKNYHSDISTDDLLDDLVRLDGECDRALTSDDVREFGKYALSNYTDRFGTWNESLRAAGIEVQREVNTPQSVLLEELLSVQQEVEGAVRMVDMDDKGNFDSTTYQDRFGSWNDALERAGIELGREVNIPRERLKQELERLSEYLPRNPRIEDMNELGEYSSTAYQREFGSWSEGLEEVGIDPHTHSDWVVSGENHGRWEGGHDQYYGEDWHKQRKKARSRDNYTCRICESVEDGEGRQYHVHHITPKRHYENDDSGFESERANSLSNLVTLCPTCHREYEGKHIFCTVDDWPPLMEGDC